jgi:hypothetical protein
MHIKIGFCLLCIFSQCHCTILSEYQGIRLSTPAGLQFKKSVKTWKDILEQHTVRQALDYSCGAASLATLIRYYFQNDIDEQTVLTMLIKVSGIDTIKQERKTGFSFFDLKKAAEYLGYQAVGVKLKVSALSKLRGPVLVHLKLSNIEHFAVLRGIKADRVFLADPARGNLRLSLTKFAQEWSGATLVLAKQGQPLPVDYPLKIQEESSIRNELQVLRQKLHRR